MKKLNANNFFTIAYWMTSNDMLALKGAKLHVYAIIYGFTQDGDNEFDGSIQYISKFAGISISSVKNCLSELVDKGYIYLTERNSKDGKTNTYRANLEILNFLNPVCNFKKLKIGGSTKITLPTGVQKLHPTGVQKLDGGSTKITPHGSTKIGPNNINNINYKALSRAGAREGKKDEFMALYPRFARATNYDDSEVDYDILIAEFSKSKFLREEVRTMKLVCEMYKNEIVTGFHRDKTPEEPKVKESDGDKRIDRERYYSILRNEAERIAERNKQFALSDIEYKDIYNSLSSAQRALARAEVFGKTEEIPQIKHAIETLEKRRVEILKNIGLTLQDLVPHCKCPKCSDTGFLPDGRACDCYK